MPLSCQIAMVTLLQTDYFPIFLHPLTIQDVVREDMMYIDWGGLAQGRFLKGQGFRKN